MENLNEKQQIEEMAKAIDDIASNAYIENYDEAIADADKIAEALYNANYRKQSESTMSQVKRSEWISVEDRLPEESCEVLTVDRTEVMCLAPYSDRYKAFNATDEDGGDRWKLTVTHWMPLPEAPKMKGDSDK